MLDDDLHVTVFNETLQPRNFIVFQQDISLGVGKYLVYAWNNRMLASGGAFWNFTLPLSFQVAGVVGNSDDYSTTNIENAKYGQSWELSQRESGAFSIKLSDRTSEQDTVNITNAVSFARRTAALMKKEHPLMASELPVDGDINFTIEPSFYIALSDEYQRGDVIDLSSIKHSFKVSYEWHKSIAQFRIRVTEDPVSGKLTFQTEHLPRASYHDAYVLDLAVNEENIEFVDKTPNLKAKRRERAVS